MTRHRELEGLLATAGLSLALLVPTASCSDGNTRSASRFPPDYADDPSDQTSDPSSDGARAGADPARAASSPNESKDGADDEAATAADLARQNASEAAREPVTVDWSGGDAAAGGDLYALHCAMCHGVDGSGDGPAAIALNPKPRDFSDGTFYIDGNANAETGEAVDLARVIQHGPAEFGGSSAMPRWEGVFTQDQLRNLVAYVQSFSDRSGDADASS